MKFFKISLSTIAIIVFTGITNLNAQSLSFSTPVNFLPEARTDKALDITNFKGAYFVTWKDVGLTGSIHTSFLGKQYATNFSQSDVIIGNEKCIRTCIKGS